MVRFHVAAFFNKCLKADYATLTEAFFHIFVNVTKAHIM